jgi:hypothetical protein
MGVGRDSRRGRRSYMTVHSDNLGLNIQQIDVGWVKRPYRAPNKPNLPFVD